MLSVSEIFKSIQGESTFAGEVCTFVRLAGCNLHCSYCDTAYARMSDSGTPQTIEAICQQVSALNCMLVEITGGEPLMQGQTPVLCRTLLQKGHRVLVETNGSLDISALPSTCVRIVDIKTPGSGAANSFNLHNIINLTATDQCKFVVVNKTDFDWSIDFVKSHALTDICTVIISPAFGLCNLAECAEWICGAEVPLRLGLQLQKYIWEPGRRGV